MSGKMEEEITLWKLYVDEGRQIWKPYKAKPGTPLPHLERHLLTKKSNDPNPTYENEKPFYEDPKVALKKAIEFYSSIQCEDGHWAGDYGGPMFLLPGYIFTCYITGVEIEIEYKLEMIRYLTNQQNEDGGWGLHIEGPSTIFGTVMNFVALRMLGVSRDDSRAVRAREFLQKNGGVLKCPQWGKFWLCTLNLMEWSALEPIPPELWWLPSWVPFHPSRWWCHCRVVYLPMAYIYGIKGRTKVTPLIKSLREELYTEDYEKINWSQSINNVASIDAYHKPSWLWNLLVPILRLYEWIHPSWIRRRATQECLDHIKYEDRVTNYICIGPVNKVMNMLSVWYAEGNSPHFKKHLERIPDYLWLSDDGMKFQGYNGSQLWDTAFAAQAICDSGFADQFKETLIKAHDYIDISQVREDVPEYTKYYRHISKGGWPFSTRQHGWPISDCTAEGIKAALKLRKLPFIKPIISDERLFDATNVILSMQNSDGGWATYEQTRGGAWLELLNPVFVFDRIMIDYNHVECTSACVQALCAIREEFPNFRRKEIDTAIKKGLKFIESVQRSDGGWVGNWAVCMCYAAWFGVSAFVAAGEPLDHPVIVKACEFLVSKQNEDGGWGESFLSCVKKDYIKTRSQVINTSWALLALMKANYKDKNVIDRGIQLLLRRQIENGDFPQEQISGVFNANCMITYTNYRNIFPIWALGEYWSYLKRIQ